MLASRRSTLKGSQLAPPSVDRKTPRVSVPMTACVGSTGSIARARIVAAGSVPTGDQVEPASSLRKAAHAVAGKRADAVDHRGVERIGGEERQNRRSGHGNERTGRIPSQDRLPEIRRTEERRGDRPREEFGEHGTASRARDRVPGQPAVGRLRASGGRDRNQYLVLPGTQEDARGIAERPHAAPGRPSIERSEQAGARSRVDGLRGRGPDGQIVRRRRREAGIGRNEPACSRVGGTREACKPSRRVDGRRIEGRNREAAGCHVGRACAERRPCRARIGRLQNPIGHDIEAAAVPGIGSQSVQAPDARGRRDRPPGEAAVGGANEPVETRRRAGAGIGEVRLERVARHLDRIRDPGRGQPGSSGVGRAIYLPRVDEVEASCILRVDRDRSRRKREESGVGGDPVVPAVARPENTLIRRRDGDVPGVERVDGDSHESAAGERQLPGLPRVTASVEAGPRAAETVAEEHFESGRGDRQLGDHGRRGRHRPPRGPRFARRRRCGAHRRSSDRRRRRPRSSGPERRSGPPPAEAGAGSSSRLHHRFASSPSPRAKTRPGIRECAVTPRTDCGPHGGVPLVQWLPPASRGLPARIPSKSIQIVRRAVTLSFLRDCTARSRRYRSRRRP